MSGLQRGRNLLRKRRKWPLSPYKAKWHETFNQRQAMESLIHQNPSNPPPHLLLPSLIDSFALYNSHPTPNAYHFIIKTLAAKTPSQSHHHHLTPVLDHLQKVAEFETPEHLLVDVIEIYAAAGRIEEAVEVFQRIPKFRCVPTARSLNALLKVICRRKEWNRLMPRVLLLSRQMRVRIEDSSFRILAIALCRIKRVACAVELLNCMLSEGRVLDGRICSVILASLCRQRDLSSEDVMRFLEEMRGLGFVPDGVDSANVIKFLVKEKKGKDALYVLNQMKADRIKPDIFCYTMVLDGVVAEADYDKMEELFDEMLVLGLVPDICAYNVYIKGLCKQGKVEDGYKMLARMEQIGCKPDVSTYNLILGECCRNGDNFRAREIMKETKSKGIGMDLRTHRIFLDCLVNCDELSDAVDSLIGMLDKNLKPCPLTAEKIICGLLQKGFVYEALHLFEKLVDTAIVPGSRALEALIPSLRQKQDISEKILIDLVNPA
ncbi:unnamed protein product [Rhodiola kirilowii]